MSAKVRLGVIGTSWWADAMHLPALAAHPLAEVRAVAGTRPEHTREFAARWEIPAAFDRAEDLLAMPGLDAVLVLTPNRFHHPIALAAVERGLHVLCEKPLGMNAIEARELTEAADRAGLVTMCPFTYRFMPHNRYLKELVDGGYLGRPYHLNLRYYSGYGRDGEYQWRLDLGEAGGGVGSDLGAHWVDLARWWFGEIEGVTAVHGRALERPPRPDGVPYLQGEDSAMILLEFANGATGSIHVSAMAYEPSPFGQRHEAELHGSDGTLRAVCDWDRVQRVDGCRIGEPALHELPVPDRLFGVARRGTVGDTYRDTFRETDSMTRGFVTAIATGTKASPDFHDGLEAQRVLDAASRSAREGRRVAIVEIEAAGDVARRRLPDRDIDGRTPDSRVDRS